MNGSKKSTSSGVSVNVPVQRVSLGTSNTPNPDALNEEDKEVLGEFSVPLGKGNANNDKHAARLASLAKAREVKRQKNASTTTTTTPTTAPPKSEPEPSHYDDDGDGDNNDTFNETASPLVDKINDKRNGSHAPEPRSDTPSLISPARKRKILQMLSEVSDDEDEQTDSPPSKKSRISVTDVKQNMWRDFVADKALDFGRFVAATTVAAFIMGTVKTMGAVSKESNSEFKLNPDWIRQ